MLENLLQHIRLHVAPSGRRSVRTLSLNLWLNYMGDRHETDSRLKVYRTVKQTERYVIVVPLLSL